MGDAASAKQPQRWSKRRKEVERYLERRRNKSLREQTKSHDNLLFLFNDTAGPSAVGACPVNAAPAPQQEGEGHGQGVPTKAVVLSGSSVRPTHPEEDAIVERHEPAPLHSEHAANLPDTESPEGPPAHVPTTSPGDTLDDWNFDFVFRPKAPRLSTTDADTLADETAECAHASAIVPSSFYAVKHEQDRNEVSSPVTGDVAANALSLVTQPHGSHHTVEGFLPQQQQRHEPAQREPVLVDVMPVANGSNGAPPRVPSRIHVERVEGVPPLPVASPLPPGTDVNIPTANYLTVDPIYNLHQQVPGFKRNEKIAKRALLASALSNGANLQETTQVISTGQALRAVFQQPYTENKPLALRVERIGPTILIDTHGEERSSVKEMREKSLMGKTLYRFEEALRRPATDASSPQLPVAEGALTKSNIVTSTDDGALAPAASGVLAAAPQRVSPFVTSSKAINRYSQTLRWEIDGLNVLVGVDTPIVLDRRSNAEQVLKLEEISEDMPPADLKRDVLNCWFDATLANVPQVGIYIHNAGVMQRFEVKKVQDLLDIVDGRTATVAMNFTSNVLQWIVNRCDKDDGSYVVFRSADDDRLQLFELPTAEANSPLADLMTDDGAPAAAEAQQSDDAQVYVNLARNCFALGRHMLEEAHAENIQKTIDLLLRSLELFLRHPESPDSADRVRDITGMLPALVGRLLGPCHAARGCNANAEDFREALLTCGRFETRLRKAIHGLSADAPTYRPYVRCLLPCSASVCVVVARAIEAFYSRGCLRPEVRTDFVTESSKDLLQVAVEGLVRLEQLHQAITRLAQAPERCAGGVGEAAVGGGAAAKKKKKSKTKGKAKPDTTNDTMAAHGAVIDPSTDIRLGDLAASLAELFGDVVLLAMSDYSSFTIKVLKAVSQRVASRFTNAQRDGPPGSSPAEPPTTLTWLATLPTDLETLSLSALHLFSKASSHTQRVQRKTAQVYAVLGRFHAKHNRYTKALEALYRARSLLKASDASREVDHFDDYYCAFPLMRLPTVLRLLGDVYARMAALKLSVSMGGSCASVTDFQPLSIGASHAKSEEEVDFLVRAVGCYEEGGWYRQSGMMQLRLVGVELDTITLGGRPADHEASEKLHGMLCQLRSRYRGESRDHQLLWEWEMLRLLTATAPDATPSALLDDALQVGAAWVQRLSGSLVVMGPVPTPLPLLVPVSSHSSSPAPAVAASTADAPSFDSAEPPSPLLLANPPPSRECKGVQRSTALAPPEEVATASVPHDKGFTVSLAEQNLQLALAHCVALESPERKIRTISHTRLSFAFLSAALDSHPGTEETARLAALAPVWSAESAEELVVRWSCMVAERALKAMCERVTNHPDQHDDVARQRCEEAAVMLAKVKTTVPPPLGESAEGTKDTLREIVAAVLRW